MVKLNCSKTKNHESEKKNEQKLKIKNDLMMKVF